MLREVLDFSQPIALMLVAVLHFLPDEDKPAQVIGTLLDALPPGSYLVASHITGTRPGRRGRRSGPTGRPGIPPSCGTPTSSPGSRSPALSWSARRGAGFGVAAGGSGPRPTPAEVSCYGGVARKV